MSPGRSAQPASLGRRQGVVEAELASAPAYPSASGARSVASSIPRVMIRSAVATHASMRSRLQAWSRRRARRACPGIAPVVAGRRGAASGPAVFAWLDAGLADVPGEPADRGIDARVSGCPIRRTPHAWLTGLVAARLAMQHATCLERSLIMQRWLMAIGRAPRRPHRRPVAA